jgi:hypothetical protein
MVGRVPELESTPVVKFSVVLTSIYLKSTFQFGIHIQGHYPCFRK